ncbi:hypothetical protein [Comamonas sp. E6]|uniref:hypothetical protein n=1 Tax=Comamonas sp. E6 TaxID=364029 RepID=UPI000636A793|nr:hypothetical protein [Comamonas sp. E6]GAO72223.1 molybdopterin synthase adenylyltransferase [Comamonas sp. E6]
MVTLTPEQFEHFIRVMILVALLGGLVGAVIWDLIQASGLGMVSGIGYLFDRHKRIKAARARATAPAVAVMPAPGAPDPSDPPGHYCTENYSTHEWVGGVCVTCGGRADWGRAS